MFLRPTDTLNRNTITCRQIGRDKRHSLNGTGGNRTARCASCCGALYDSSRCCCTEVPLYTVVPADAAAAASVAAVRKTSVHEDVLEADVSVANTCVRQHPTAKIQAHLKWSTRPANSFIRDSARFGLHPAKINFCRGLGEKAALMTK